ncbi:MAG: GNAT family N-acetyltransferase [Anaerolineae bacterium]|nr:GNAT family N-acetyltransferase [Anaerolineae bacterium]
MTSDQELRRQIRPLLDLSAPADGVAAYYSLYHDPQRTRLFVAGPAERPRGFLAVCQTGQDLFRQTAVLRARSVSAATSLLQRGLAPRRPYYLVTTTELRPAAEAVFEAERVKMNRIYRIDLRRYNPQTNVLVTPALSANGASRFVIQSQESLLAEAGISWLSPHFAEIYVWTAPEARGRGWGKAVADSCVAWIIRSGIQPLYVVEEDDEASIRLAKSVGFVDSGAREMTVEGTVRPDGGADPGPPQGGRRENADPDS